MKITKSRLIQIIKEELDREAVNREKKDALEAMLPSAEGKRLDASQLKFLFPKSDPKVIEEKLKELESIRSYKDALEYLLYQEEPIDPEGNSLEFSS